MGSARQNFTFVILGQERCNETRKNAVNHDWLLLGTVESMYSSWDCERSSWKSKKLDSAARKNDQGSRSDGDNLRTISTVALVDNVLNTLLKRRMKNRQDSLCA